MLLDARQFMSELQQAIDAKRSFGRHPLWLKIAEGKMSHSNLQVWAKQFFLQVREFPRAVSGLHTNCPFADERVKLAESIYEEETGRISGCNVAHPELFIRFGSGLGLRRPDLVEAEPFPGTTALIRWFESATRDHSFIEGAAAINLAAEGQVPGAFAPFARALQRHYGLTQEQVAFWDIHEEADREHSDIGDHIVAKHTDTADMQEKVRQALTRSLSCWWEFFEDIERHLS
ncbi:MAG TPA: iron-containing redox enzyme family protein [Candidatus Acidoferrales bacterium]|nr:iron-containing redox enzyme family protein [Candidatus Acidoferrales bacterium]